MGKLIHNGITYAQVNIYTPPQFSDYYTYTSIPSDTIQAGYVMCGLWSANISQNWVHLAVDTNPLIYYDTTNGTIVRGNRYVSNDYISNIPPYLLWCSEYNKMSVPPFISVSGSQSYSVSVSDLSKYIYLRTVDILDQNGNVVLGSNCTLADLGLV